MSKTALEMFRDIKEFETPDGSEITVADIVPYFCEKIEKALQRLEAIDNANPSEALEETLRDIAYDLENDDNPFLRDRYYGLLDVKQALLKSQEQEKVLEIILEKNVDIGLLKRSENWLDYYTRFKHRTGKNTELTEEEFELLKEIIRRYL